MVVSVTVAVGGGVGGTESHHLRGVGEVAGGQDHRAGKGSVPLGLGAVGGCRGGDVAVGGSVATGGRGEGCTVGRLESSDLRGISQVARG